MPGIVAGVLLTFIPAAGDYVNVIFLGGTSQAMIGNVIQSKYLVVNDYPAAAALSFTLMAIILVALAAAALLPGDDVAFLVVTAALAACSLFALHLGNLQRPDYTKRNAIVMLGLLGVFALVGAGRFAWTVLGA